MAKYEERLKVTEIYIDTALDILKSEIMRRIDQKGDYSFINDHEFLGIVTEEYNELIEAVKSNNTDNVSQEGMDIAVACVFNVAGIIATRLAKDLKE